MNKHTDPSGVGAEQKLLDPRKFEDPDRTVDGKPRAKIPLNTLKTLWINTGTICNIECAHCYIESSPSNDRLQFFEYGRFKPLLDEAIEVSPDLSEIGFTGGEPFINPDTLFMMAESLERDLNVLVLTNAMRPMTRPKVQSALLRMNKFRNPQLTLRVSLDHFDPALHDQERGSGSFDISMEGLRWLSSNDFTIHVAGRTCFEQDEDQMRRGFQSLFHEHCISIDAMDPSQLILFPEMDEAIDISEITTACWDILGKTPNDLMCSESRMVVHHKDEEHPTIVPCTLLPYQREFDMGSTLKDSLTINTDYFDQGQVKLCHPHCARFCVLGGGSCTA